jgi:hypothetical protein
MPSYMPHWILTELTALQAPSHFREQYQGRGPVNACSHRQMVHSLSIIRPALSAVAGGPRLEPARQSTISS